MSAQTVTVFLETQTQPAVSTQLVADKLSPSGLHVCIIHQDTERGKQTTQAVQNAVQA